LGGPPCTYVGHPLIEQIDTLRPNADEQIRRCSKPPVLLVLPGSRRSEIRHHMETFGATLDLLRKRGMGFDLILPTMPHLVEGITEALKRWPVQPRVVVGEAEKRAAFRIAHAAFAKSGTVTLELALAGVPMVTAYQAGKIEARIIRRFVTASSVILANLVIGENVIPEFIQEDCTPEKLAASLQDVLADTPMRRRQVEAMAKLDDIMGIGSMSPSKAAADVIAGVIGQKRH
jgi:lipid-A-disaccharide synthase